MPADDRRRQLLEAALNVFSRRGFDGATTKEIAAEAGVTEAIVFRHFPNKSVLYTAVRDHKFQSHETIEGLAELKDCMERNDDEGFFLTIAGKILSIYRTDLRFERVMLFAALEGHQQALEHHHLQTMPIFRLLEKYLLRRQREGALLDYQPAAILGAIAGMAQHHGVMTHLFGFKSRVSDEEVAETCVRILMDGVRGPRKKKVAKTRK